MAKRSSSASIFTPGNLSRGILIVAILGGLLLSYHTTPSHAAEPPNGGGVGEVYVDNLKGNDTTGDGSQTHPYATIEKGNHSANISGAGLVRLYIKANPQPYQLANDFYPKRNNEEFLVWGSGRPIIQGNPDSSWLSLFDIQNYSGIRLEGFMLRDVAVEIRGGMNDIIRNNQIVITDPTAAKLIAHNNGAVISSYIWDYTQPGIYITQNLSIDHNTLILVSTTGPSLPPIIGIRLQSDRSAKIYNNTYSRMNTGDTLVSVFDTIDSDFGANTYNNPANKQAVYAFDHTNDSRVYEVWPF